MFGKLQKMHQKKQNDVGARPTRLSPTKHGQTSYPNLQESFCSDPQRSGRQVSTLALVLPRATGRTHRQPTSAKQRGPQDFGICTRTRAARLHAQTVCTPWMLGHGVKPKNRRTWDTHGEVGFNIGRSITGASTSTLSKQERRGLATRYFSNTNT